jgi:hypothetical protein
MSQQPYGPGQPQHQQHQQYWVPQSQPYPPQQYGYPPAGMMMPPPEPRNGLGLAALICAIVGVLCGLVPIAFILGGPLSIIAIALGITGMGRVRRGAATNSRSTNIAVILGILALLMAFNGARVVFTAVDQFGKTVNQMGDDNQRRQDCITKAKTADEIWACAG